MDPRAHHRPRGCAKPDNILIATRDGGLRVKIVEFGLAILAMGDQPDARITRQGGACGTPTLTRPEQILGGSIDERSDLYSLGVVMFWMLEGRPPFVAPQVAELLRMHVERAPPPLPRAGWRLEALVHALLAKGLRATTDGRRCRARAARSCGYGVAVEL